MALAIHTWWEASHGDRYWLEVTGRTDLGADLKAPQRNEQGGEFWGYSLLKYVRKGDLVYHYDRSRSPQGIVAVSRATGDFWEDDIVWAARGTYARNAGIEPHRRSGYYSGLESFDLLSSPLTLDQIRLRTTDIQSQLQVLERLHGRPLYFPFESSDKRALRPLQGYLFKLPAFFVEIFPELRRGSDYPNSIPTASVSESSGGVYRRPDEQTTVGTADPFSVDPAVIERGTRAHAAAQNALADYLTSKGIEPLSPSRSQPYFDLAWRADGRLWVAEVKSLTSENEERQLRLGLGQVLRYRHLLESSSNQLVGAVLLLERPPTDRTWLDLCEKLEVVVAWPGQLVRIDP
jgi:hypothetical protein